MLQRIQHLQLRLDALDISAAVQLQGHAAFGCSAQGWQRPQQAAAAHHQNVVVPLQRNGIPEALLQPHQPPLFEGQLALQPAFHRWVVWATAEWLPLLAFPFHGRGELGGPVG